MKTLIIDGNNLGMRAFGQVPLEFNGKRTETILIGLNMIRQYIAEFSPDAVVVCWDGGHDARRKALYPDYKKKKPLTEDERKALDSFFDQIRSLRDTIKKLGIYQWQLRGREADDVIFNLLEKTTVNSLGCIVVSTDEDMFQLLSWFPFVKIYSPIKKLMVDDAAFEEKFKMPTTQFLLYKAMVGDKSDNLPGVRGVGPAKAAKILEVMQKDPDDCTQKERDLVLTVDTDDFYTMLELVSFMEIDQAELDRGAIIPDNMTNVHAAVLEFAEQFGFQRILDTFDRWVEPFLQMTMRAE